MAFLVRRSWTSLSRRCAAAEAMFLEPWLEPKQPDPRTALSCRKRHYMLCTPLSTSRCSAPPSSKALLPTGMGLAFKARWFAKSKSKGDPWPGYCRKMEHAIEHFYHELSGVRTGRASPTLLDSVMVDSHGERTNLSHVATVVLKSTHMLSITVYDKAMAPGVLAAIRKSPLQLQPREEGGEVIVPVPQMSPETRKAMIKLAHQHAEQSRVTIRQARHKAMTDIKALSKQLSEDDRKSNERQVDDLTQQFVQRVDAALHAKEKELDY